MSEVEQLVKEINFYKEQLVSLEQGLKAIQRACKHQFLEERAYRVCLKCQVVESNHY